MKNRTILTGPNRICYEDPMSVTVHIARAFCRKSLGGNPAGVAILNAPLSPFHMQTIASLLNFSETIFLLQKGEHDYLAKYYTPTSAIDFCGHASLAAFGVLSQIGALKSTACTLDTPAGTCAISINGPFVYLSQFLPEFGKYIDVEEIAPTLGIDCAHIQSTQLKPQIVSTGLKDILIPIASQKALFSMCPNHTLITQLCEKYDVIGMHVFTLDPFTESVTAQCRNFAPRYGIPEESATGSSSGALACYLFQHNRTEKETMLFQQGDILDSPSDIYIRLTAQCKIEKVECGGEVVIDGIKEIKLPL